MNMECLRGSFKKIFFIGPSEILTDLILFNNYFAGSN